jgi:hypothetical protein
MTGFPIPESREQFGLAERIQIHALMCKCRSTERVFLKSKRNGAGREWDETDDGAVERGFRNAC